MDVSEIVATAGNGETEKNTSFFVVATVLKQKESFQIEHVLGREDEFKCCVGGRKR